MPPLFRKTLTSLAHPITLLAILILLVNDHLLRVFQPSWLTGKLGDAAWLFFAPLLLLLILSAGSALFPRMQRRERLLVLLAYSLVGAV